MTPFVTTVIGSMRHHRGPVDGRTLCGCGISEPHRISAAYGRDVMELPLCRKCERVTRVLAAVVGYVAPGRVQAYGERDQLRAQRDDALDLIDDLLRPWSTGRRVHPGREAVDAGFQDLRQIRAWTERRDALRAAMR